MKTDKFIEDKIEASLNSLEGVQKAMPSPFFYTRVIAKLIHPQQNIWEKLSALITRPAMAFSCICFIVLMNVMAIYTNSENASSTDQNDIATIDEFTQVTPNFYDLENIKP